MVLVFPQDQRQVCRMLAQAQAQGLQGHGTVHVVGLVHVVGKVRGRQEARAPAPQGIDRRHE
jgi:hypothetical protein